jgi:glycosyltransferase involved in cell wall biosynthesis
MVIVLLFLAFTTVYSNIRRKEYENLLIQLFAIGYILANLIFVLNERYNLPLYPILIILAMQALNLKPFSSGNETEKDTQKEEITDPKVLLIVPAYNEALNIQKTCEDLLRCDTKPDFIVIDDGSTDETVQICKTKGYPYISLVRNLGIGGAVQTGYKYADKNGYDIAVQFDGDGQHNADYIGNLIEPIKTGQADFVIGSRFIDDTSEFKSTAARRIGINVISSLIILLSGINITDPTSGFRAANRKTIELFARDYPVEYPEPETIFMLLKRNFRVTEVPVKMNKREGGISSINSWKSVYYMINIGLSLIVAKIRREK